MANKTKKDWPSWKIKTELMKRNLTLRSMSLELGRPANYLADALRSCSHPAQMVIAKAIDKNPRDIWPSRYEGHRRVYTLDPNGKRLSRRTWSDND